MVCLLSTPPLPSHSELCDAAACLTSVHIASLAQGHQVPRGHHIVMNRKSKLRVMPCASPLSENSSDQYTIAGIGL